MNKKKNNKGGCGCLVFGFLLIFVLYILGVIVEALLKFNEKTNGFGVPVSGVIALIAAGFILFKVCKASLYMRNHMTEVSVLNRCMNDADTLDMYFRFRDELVTLLENLSKDEFWTIKKYRYALKTDGLPHKPSYVLAKIRENEELHVNSTIKRIYAGARKKIKDGESGCAANYEWGINKCAERLSADNLKTARACIELLQDYEVVAGKIEETDGMDGHVFEYWCADLLRDNGFSGVEVTPGSGDQGVDVLAVKDGIRYAVQCKCYSSDLGNTPVQEVHAGKEMYSCQIGAVMTNRYFTKGAKELAARTGVLLWDRDKLKEMLQK